MTRTISIGSQDFTKIRKNNYFYIDKTLFIKEWWESGDETTLITRPRRFGKTLTMDMVNKFFNVKYKDEGFLFEGLNIYKEEKYRELQGTYPVIFLSFAEIKESTYKNTIEQICRIIMKLYSQYEDILDKDEYSRINYDMSEITASSSIQLLTDLLYKHYQKKVIIIIDEYDTPMQEAYLNGFWDELSIFMRSFFNSTFKTNSSLERGLMTGITRVSKESIFSDLNHLKIVTTTSDKYAESFGFIEEEVFDALKEYELYETKEEVKNWYDGFIFGKVKDIYNPWSIINYLDERKFGYYWTNTSGNGLISKLIQEGNKEIKTKLETLITGESIKVNLDEQIIFNQLDKTEDAKWSLMIACGYLKVDNFNLIEESYELSIVNYETKHMFRKMIKKWFGKASYEYNEFIKALLKNDIKSMNAFMNRISKYVFSYFDTGHKPSFDAPERFYHGFILGLIVELRDSYIIKSNPESGLGRCDVLMKPINKENVGIIMEFRVIDEEKSLEETANNALKQIEEKEYEINLKAEGITNIRKYGFAFRGKEILIIQA